MYSYQPPAPFADLIPDETGDYTLTIFLGFNRNDDRRDAGGHFVVSPDHYRGSMAGNYCIEAGRRGGAWRLRVSPWTGEFGDDGDILGEPIVDLRDQTDGTDPLTALYQLLTGQAQRDGD